MAYYLNFFGVLEGEGPPAGTLAEDVPQWIRSHGRPAGEMEFGAGRATFVLAVLSKVSGVYLSPLQEGPWRDIECAGEKATFGGLSRAESQAAVAALRAAPASHEKKVLLGELTVKYGLEDENMPERCLKLAQVLERCMEAGCEPVTLYQ